MSIYLNGTLIDTHVPPSGYTIGTNDMPLRMGTGILYFNGKMDEIASSISAAIEEQAATTGGITQNVQQAAAGTQETMESIRDVQTATEETENTASEVLDAAKQLMSRSDELRSSVDEFLQGIKTA